MNPFNFDDYRASFLAILQGLMAKNGLNMASEGHFKTLAANASELAHMAERKLSDSRAIELPAGKSKSARTIEAS